jgi:Tol biopolymer transport system component
VTAAKSKIAFLRSSGYVGLWVVNADGSGRRRLLETGQGDPAIPPEFASHPAWSPDGRSIAFVGKDDDGNVDVHIVQVDGRGRQRLTSDPAVDGRPAWSPDGWKIAFTRRGPRETFQIYVMNADGSGQRRLTRNGWVHFSVAWSPDGQKMLFERPSLRRGELPKPACYCAEEIWIMNSDGSGQRRLTRNPARDGGPAWSPDGHRIVFSREWQNGHREIYVMNADGSGQRSLTRNRSSFGPAWSPDGRKIVFFSDRDGNDEIYVMNADGTKQRRLTRNPGNDWGPHWSPDGQMIAFERDRSPSGEELHVMNADGSGDRSLTRNGVRFVIPFAWSPAKRP